MRKNRKIVKFLVIVLTLFLYLSSEFFCISGITITAQAATTSGTVTASLLNVRTGAGTKYSILKSGSRLVRLSKGTNVTINSEKSGWYNISFNYSGKSLSGYVSKSYIKKGSASTNSTSTSSGTTGTVTASSLNIRTGASTSKSILKHKGSYVRLKKGATVNILATSGNWHRISFNYSGTTLTGYASADYISKSVSVNTFTNNSSSSVSSQTGLTTADRLNVRVGAGTSYKILTYGGKYVKLTKGTKVSITSTIGSWYRVNFTYSGTTLSGYISSAYVSKTSAVTQTPAPTAAPPVQTPTLTGDVMGSTTADRLNIRTGAGTSYSLLKNGSTYVKLTKGTKVVVLSSTGSWYNIKFIHGNTILTGYASSMYINITSGSLQTPTPAPTVAPAPVTPTTAPVKTLEPVPTTAPVQTQAPTQDETPSTDATTSNKGRVTADTSLNVRTGAGTSFGILTHNNQYIRLAYNTIVTIEKEESGWYYISFTYSEQNLKGYVSTAYVERIVETTQTPEESAAPPSTDIIGNVTASVLNVRTGAGTTYDLLKYNNQYVKLSTGASIKIVEKLDGWYYIEFTYNNTKLNGYVSADYVTILSSDTSDADFEAKLEAQGFPESYKVLLRKLHEEHPNWEFVAYNTGLDWDTVVARESVVGVNLIPNSKNVSWKSLETGAYSWATNKFIPYDGSSWVSASSPVVAYYMDPRNFLYDTTIFQFELLAYQEGYQTKEGVEGILKNTAMYNSAVNYTENGVTNSMLYSDIFMAAAKYSGVSPYHLASRVKQEVVTGSTTLSSSVSGTVAGYEGYYNYYNIGASNSTLALGAIKNGLNYAKNGTSSATTNASYLIPWTDAYKAIVGGAKFISTSYIARGQNTIYLEKFNVTPKSTYSHQYMSNVQAAWSESVKVAAAYKEIENFDSLPIVFSIPIYNNMPATPCALPADAKNPNNWLKSLSVSGYSLTPTFDVNKNQEYSIIVGSDVSSVTIAATPVTSSATLQGTGAVSIAQGTNRIEISVTAENGDVRKYILNIVKN